MMQTRRPPTVLVRWRAWWFNKVPLSVTLVLLLLDGRPFSTAGMVALLSVVVTVCAVGNYGYALNELFDVEEDERLGRNNAAAASGAPHMWLVIAVSAVIATGGAAVAARGRGVVLTAVELLLPLCYSIPPLRVKERKWLGVVADALAAHVYPALLALLTVEDHGLLLVGPVLWISVSVWALAAGLRGILSHQLHTAEPDLNAGLITVVHDYGRARVEGFILKVLLPLETAGLVAAVADCSTGPVLWVLGALYVAYELYKTLAGGFVVVAFRPEGQPYVPLVDEAFYKAWGPLLLAADAARTDLPYLIFIPVYAACFRPHLRAEMLRWRSVRARAGTGLLAGRARETDARSNEGS
jgi:4-hydroxybenzoate polyprenyltransferase